MNLLESIVIGATMAVIPRTRPMLAILLPITLPIANSGAASNEARMATASSGADVPNAITVAPITNGLIFKNRARRVLPFTRKSAPKKSRASPATIFTKSSKVD